MLKKGWQKQNWQERKTEKWINKILIVFVFLYYHYSAKTEYKMALILYMINESQIDQLKMQIVWLPTQVILLIVVKALVEPATLLRWADSKIMVDQCATDSSNTTPQVLNSGLSPR